MKSIVAFFKLIRWPNLVFIIITQLLFYYCIYVPLLANAADTRSHILFGMLITASICIAAAGYIINDYFDVQIDSINKPAKLIIDKHIKRRWAILWHWILSAVGMSLSTYISFKTGLWIISGANFACVVFLWFYSTTFKKKILTGNIIIAALTAWVIIVVYFFAGADFFRLNGWADINGFNARKLFKFTILFSGFAFIISLVREVIKDMEDMDGDRKYHCRTMPIVWGVPASKVFTAVWLVVCIAALTTVSLYAWQAGWWLAALYVFLFCILPLGYILKKLYAAATPAQYHLLSNMVKAVTLAGIISMLFFIFPH